MTASTEQPGLLPCPFCGSEAHFEMDDDRWEWVECEGCGMQGNRSASLMEDCKPKLREAWNRRAPASQEQRVPLSGSSLAYIGAKHFGNPIPREWYSAARYLETTHGITQEKQR